MATVALVRHGRTTANASGTLAGRLDGVELDDVGREQVRIAAERLQPAPVVRLVASPLLRCQQTAEVLARGQNLTIESNPQLNECDYGQWQGRSLSELTSDDLWPVVQRHPSSVQFPGGESMRAMQERAVSAVRDVDGSVTAEYGQASIWVAVSHGDVIKSIVADALGLHLDHFQRISVHPASISIVHYGLFRPDVVAVNTEAGALDWLAAADGIGPATPTIGGGAGAIGPERA